MDFHRLDVMLDSATPTVAPAMVCRVEQAGHLRFERAYGWLDPVPQRHPTGTDSLFDLASLTKLFTATACLRLASQGRLRIDQPVVTWVPEFDGQRPIGATEDPITKAPLPADVRWASHPAIDASAVTVRQLLTHCAGLPAWRSLYKVCGPPPLRHGCHRAEILRRQHLGIQAIAGYPFSYPPGASYAYSDTGLILLGVLVARAHGAETLAESIADLVAVPLKLEAQFSPPSIQLDRIPPTEYCRWRQRRLRGEVHDENAAGLGGIAGHAGLFATAADLCRLGRLYLAGGEQLLARELVAESIAEQVCASDGTRRGLGWMLRSGPAPSCSLAFSEHSFGHTGFTGTSLWCDPARELVVALLTNRVYHGRKQEAITALRPAVHAAIVAAIDG